MQSALIISYLLPSLLFCLGTCGWGVAQGWLILLRRWQTLLLCYHGFQVCPVKLTYHVY